MTPGESAPYGNSAVVRDGFTVAVSVTTPAAAVDSVLRVGHPCGLCNRIDVIATGCVLARARGIEAFDVLWPRNARHMPAGFHDFFTALPRGRVLEEEIAPAMLQAYYAAVSELPPDYRQSEEYGTALRQLLARVVPEVRSQVKAFVEAEFARTSAGAGPMVGIHIRRSEAPWPLCPYAQPLRYYEAVVRSLPTKARCFVSTDSQHAYRWLRDRFGNRILQRPKNHNERSSVAGIREGLVDMLLLSECDLIVGTYGSSFSGTAALAGRRPILVVKAWPEVPAAWPSFSIGRWLWAYRHFLVESTWWRRSFDWVIRPQAARAARVPRRVVRMVRARASLTC